MYKKVLALNDLQWLICPIQPNPTQPNVSVSECKWIWE